jgi:cytochrome c553
MLALAWHTGHADISELLPKCTICHGEDGISAESAYPSIAGIPVAVQFDAMLGYRDGTRDCGPVSRMCKITEELSDEEILRLSESHRHSTLTSLSVACTCTKTIARCVMVTVLKMQTEAFCTASGATTCVTR